MVRGWHYGPQFDLARPLLDISEVPQLDNGMQMLVHRRIDLLASNERNSAPAILALGMAAQLTMLCPAIAQLDGFLAFPRDPQYASARQRYNALFTDMVRSGELARLGAKHGVLVPAAGASAQAGVPCTGKAEPLRPR